MSETLKAKLADEAAALGLSAFGVTRPDAVLAAGTRLRAWIAAGRQGEMAWMADRIDWRADPAALWPAARSVIMVAENYGPEEDPLALLEQRDRGAISVYARHRDYHDVLKKKLKRLGRFLITEAAADGLAAPEIKVFVDTAPVMEKPLAEAAGLGWTGKHTNLVARAAPGGSWLFLGAVFTTLELPVDASEEDRCGGCRRCLDICPTAAFPAPYQLDARRCVSYLTIELKGPIPRRFRPLLGNRIYGCDDCLAVCPWNKFARRAAETRYHARDDLAAPALAELAALDAEGFRTRFSGSPIKRIGRARLLRNVAIALGNAGPRADRGALARLLDDAEPLVRGAAVWALGRVDPADARREQVRRAGAETDAQVRAEWAAIPPASPPPKPCAEG